MERDMKKIIETLQSHEADNALINDVLVMILNNQIQSTKTTKNCLLEIKENIESERTNKNKAIEIIKDFVVDLKNLVGLIQKGMILNLPYASYACGGNITFTPYLMLN